MGPVLSLGMVLLPDKSKLAWFLWVFAGLITGIHWYSYLSATAENANKIGLLWVTVWTPLLLTTLIAGLTGNYWRNYHNNQNVTRSTVALVCAIPSIVALIILI